MAVVEATDRNTKLVWTQIKSPADCRAADGAEVGVHFASLGGVPAGHATARFKGLAISYFTFSHTVVTTLTFPSLTNGAGRVV